MAENNGNSGNSNGSEGGEYVNPYLPKEPPTPVDAVNAEIKALDDNRSNMLEEKYLAARMKLYEKKSNMLKWNPTEQSSGFQDAFEKEKADPKNQSMNQNASAEAEKAAAEKARPLLVNSIGQDGLDTVQEFIDPLFTPQSFQSFTAKYGLNTDYAGQVEIMTHLNDLVNTKSSTVLTNEAPTEPAVTVRNVEKNLREFFGDRYETTMTQARQVAVDLFGSMEKAETFFTQQGWSRSAKAQAKAVIILAKIGRRRK